MESLRVTGNLLAPLVSGVEWRHLLGRQSPHQKVLSKFTFTSAFVSRAIICDNINGLDLSEDAVQVDTTQTIYGETCHDLVVKVLCCRMDAERL